MITKAMKGLGMIGSGVLAAILSSLCCIAPVVTLIAGTSSLAASISWLGPARPYLAAVTILILGFAWYSKVYPKKSTDPCACDNGKRESFLQSKSFLAIISLFALTMLAFPYYAHVFFTHQNQQAMVADTSAIKTAEFKITGMTCQGCAEHVMYEANKLAGVLQADASFEKANAIVKYDEGKVSLAEIEQAINGTGYKVIQVVQSPGHN